MRRGIVDAIYWKMHAAFLRNERSDAEMFLAMLEDEMRKAPGALAQEAGVVHARRFEKIRESIIQGSYGRLRGAGAGLPNAPMALQQAERSGPEDAFCKALLSSRAAFLDAIGAPRGSVIATQVDMSPYGRVDFLICDWQTRTWYVVEVKMGEAPTSIVSQVDKYILAAELDMCLGLHDDVVGVVLAEGFGPYVRAELSRMAVHIIEHDGSPDGLRRMR